MTIGAMIIAAAVSAAVFLAMVPRTVDGRAVSSNQQVPQLLSGPLTAPLQPGWRVTATTLGLPQDTYLGLPPFATNGNRAYFVTNCAQPCTGATWLYGIDTHTGRLLFEPVALPDFPGLAFGHCTGNGPNSALCLTSRPERRAWVVDLTRGAVSYTGSTNLSWLTGSEGSPVVRPVGSSRGPSWAVADVRGKGVYGIGPHAELTWFVAGDGQYSTRPLGSREGAPLSVELASTKNPAYRVFSAADGHELTPTPPKGAALKRAVVYPGGFAYQYEDDDSAGVLFYAADGRLRNRVPMSRYNLLDNVALPVVLDNNMFRLFQPDGNLIANIPVPNNQPPLFRFAGQTAFLWIAGVEQRGEHWQSWNLAIDTKGATCNAHLSDYLGTDGHTLLTTVNIYSGYTLIATDISTCQPLWRKDVQYSRILQVGDGLIAYDGHQIVSLEPQ